MNEYDIQEELKRIEDELIASMIRNMERHRAEETKEGFEWGMWQAEQLKALEEYKKRNKERYKDQCGEINSSDQRIKKTWIFRSGSTNLGIYW